MLNWLNWSEKRLLWTLAVTFLVLAELISIPISSVSPCIISPQYQSADEAGRKECPPLHVVFVNFSAPVLEKRGDPNWAVAIFTGVLAISTIGLWRSTERLWQAARSQGSDMQRSITESARAASAMEKVAEHVAVSAKAATESVETIKDASARQMRAYVCVNFGNVIQQDNATDYHFEVRLLLVNVGPTPAYDVGYTAHADVLPFPLPNDFSFPVANIHPGSASTLGAGQNFLMTGVVDKMYSDKEITDLKSGGNQRLYMYGTAIYKDVFGTPRYINFCYSIAWMKDGKSTIGHYTKRHNDAN
jgi:hypothetical protein